MNIELKRMDRKMFQFFPLRTENILKHITVDTKTLIEILETENKIEKLSNIMENKHPLWEKYFKINKKIFNSKNYEFDYQIQTNGYTVSILLIHKSFVADVNKSKENLRNGRNEKRELYKGVEQEKKEEMKLITINAKKEKKNETLKELKDSYAKLTDVEKKAINKRYIEFPYLEELTAEQIEELKKYKLVYVDPGKRDLLYMMDDDGKIYVYSNAQRLFETKRLEYQQIIQKYKDNCNISGIEHLLSDFNSKEYSIKEFKKYLKMKNDINNILIEQYKMKIFRKYKWYSYINTQRSEDNLINRIKEIYGEDIILIYGDWSVGQQMRNFISTPNIGLKRKLSKEFTIYSIDEFKTSSVSCKNNKELCNNLILPNKEGVEKKLHAVLTYKMKNGRKGCINRDNNSVNNMKTITHYWLEHKKRPIEFSRKQTIKKTQNKIEVSEERILVTSKRKQKQSTISANQ